VQEEDTEKIYMKKAKKINKEGRKLINFIGESD